MFSNYYSPYSSPAYGYGYQPAGYAQAQAAAQERRRRQQLAALQQQQQLERERLARAQAQAQARARAARYLPRQQNPYYQQPYDQDDDEDEEFDDQPQYDYGFGHVPHPFMARRQPSRSPQRTAPTRVPVRSPSPEAQTQTEPQPKPQTPPPKSPSPTPAPQRVFTEREDSAASTIQSFFRTHLSHRQISSVHEKLSSLVSSFVFPEIIDFADGPDRVISLDSQSGTPFTSVEPLPSPSSKPKLAYTAHNRPLLGQIEDLSRLLTQLDGIESWGNKKVRQHRKAVVNEIEAAISRLEGSEDDANDLEGWRGVWRRFVQSASAPAAEAAEAVAEPASQPAELEEPMVEGAQLEPMTEETKPLAAQVSEPVSIVEGTEPSTAQASKPVSMVEETEPTMTEVSEPVSMVEETEPEPMAEETEPPTAKVPQPVPSVEESDADEPFEDALDVDLIEQNEVESEVTPEKEEDYDFVML